MTKYNSIDLFSGIGGLSLGLKDAGFRVVASIELDDNAVEAYKKNRRCIKCNAGVVLKMTTKTKA